jgi:arginase family enzyme
MNTGQSNHFDTENFQTHKAHHGSMFSQASKALPLLEAITALVIRWFSSGRPGFRKENRAFHLHFIFL